MYANTCYGDFAYVYDLLTDDVEYKKRADYIENIIFSNYCRCQRVSVCVGTGVYVCIRAS